MSAATEAGAIAGSITYVTVITAVFAPSISNTSPAERVPLSSPFTE